MVKDCGVLRTIKKGSAAHFVIVMKPFVGRGHVPAVREAADGTGEQVCTKSVVPAFG